jgi:hypothetical protein
MGVENGRSATRQRGCSPATVIEPLRKEQLMSIFGKDEHEIRHTIARVILRTAISAPILAFVAYQDWTVWAAWSTVSLLAFSVWRALPVRGRRA